MKKPTNALKKTDGKKPKHNHSDFDTIILEATRGMPRHKQLFSRFIHISLISSISDALGKTIMRPNAILFGAITSFSLTLFTYLLSKNLGYSLSGSESIVFFAVGWITGLAFDTISNLVGKR